MASYIFDKALGCVVDKETGQPSVLGAFVEPRIHLALDYKPYRCPVTGKPVEGRRAHQENLKRTGCRILEKGEREQAERNRGEEDRKIERVVGEAVEKTAAQLNF